MDETIIAKKEKNTVSLSIFTATVPVTKTYTVVEGEIKKTPSAKTSAYTATRKNTPFYELGAVLSDADEKTALVYGVHSTDLPDTVQTVKKGNENPLKNIMSRTKDYLTYQGQSICMTDYDTETGRVGLNPDELKSILSAVCPEFKTAASFTKGSVSAGVHFKNDKPREGCGFHLFNPVLNGTDIPRFGNALFERLVLAGHGYIKLSKVGSMLLRTIIDKSVYSPERLDFIGKPVIKSDDLMYTPPELIYTDGGYLDTSKLLDLSAKERKKYDSIVSKLKAVAEPAANELRKAFSKAKVTELIKQGVPKEKAQRTVKALITSDYHDLLADFVIQFDTKGAVSVRDILSDPMVFDCCVCADPLEVGKGFGKAKFYWNNGEKPFINSFVRGGQKYFLHSDSGRFGIAVSGFPHKGARGFKLATVENLQYLLEAYGIVASYNEISKEQDILFDDRALDELVPDVKAKVCFSTIESLIALNELPHNTVDRLPVIFGKNVANPIVKFFESKVWDGVDRITALADTLKVSKEDEKYALLCLRTWLIQCGAAADNGARSGNNEAIRKFELVLILQGDQGATKTSWVSSLLPKELSRYVRDGVLLRTGNKDSIKIAVSAWICELGELDATFRACDISALKGFLSNREDILRLPYDRAESTMGRRTSFFASVNPSKFLMDETGNRRFLPVQVTACNRQHNIDLQQLWAQVWSLYLGGEPWWVGKGSELELMLVSRHKRHETIDPIIELLEGTYAIGCKGEDVTKRVHYNATRALMVCGVREPKKHQTATCIEHFKKRGLKMKAVNGCRGYYLTVREEGKQYEPIEDDDDVSVWWKNTEEAA